MRLLCSPTRPYACPSRSRPSPKRPDLSRKCWVNTLTALPNIEPTRWRSRDLNNPSRPTLPKQFERGTLTRRKLIRLLRHNAFAFPELLAPLVLIGTTKLNDELRPIARPLKELLADSAWDCLWDSLAARLSMILEATLYGQFSDFRGERAFRPYHEFCRLCLSSNYSNLTGQYASLSSRVHLEISAFVRSTSLFLSRLVVDHKALSQSLLSETALRINAVSPALSEPHNGGLSTLALTTECGITILYKPKSCTGDRLFHHVMCEVGNRNPKLQLRAPRLLLRRDYAWMEHIRSEPLSRSADNFYFKVGVLLAIAYALRASDVTSDNLIAAGDNPVLVDAEVVLLPQRAEHLLRSFSVADVGLLPRTALQSLGGRVLDQSGLAQHRHFAIGATWIDLNTDHMNRAPTLVASNEAVNLPCTPEGVREPCSKHATNIVAGFSEAYSELLEFRPTLLQNKRFKRLVRCASPRVIIRSTDCYLLAIKRTLHPDSFRLPAHERGDILRKTLAADSQAFTTEFELECNALARGDVPYFFTKPDSRGIYSEIDVIADFFVEAPERTLFTHIKKMSIQDRDIQLASIIRAIKAS